MIDAAAVTHVISAIDVPAMVTAAGPASIIIMYVCMRYLTLVNNTWKAKSHMNGDSSNSIHRSNYADDHDPQNHNARASQQHE